MTGGLRPRPRRSARIRGGVALPGLLACLALSGCAALLRPFDRAPSGLSRWDQSVRDELVAGRFDSALALAGPDRADAGDDLLRLEYEGILAHYAGMPDRSRAALGAASQLAEDRYTRSLSRTLLSFFTGDRTRAYDPPLVDRLFLHYYGALDYLATGDDEDAAVEARRLEQRLALAGDESEDPGERGLAAAMHAFAGTVFEAAGRSGEAAVSYRLARRAAGDTTRDEGSTPVPAAEARPAPVGEGTRPSVDEGTVVVVLERGFVAHRVERSLTLLLWPGELTALRTAASGDVSARRRGETVADDVARRSLGLVPVSDGPGPGHGEGSDPYLLRVAWPTYAAGRVPDARIRLLAPGVGSDSLIATELGVADVSTAVRSDFARQAPGILARTLVRAVAKRVAVEAVKKTASRKDETLGEIVGLAANVTSALLEQADTRGLDLLPARVRLVRVRVPAGRHRLHLEVLEPGRPRPRSLDLGVVHVEAGRVVVVPVRIWEGGRAR
ncbi:MAG: hypothetical protein Q8W51_04555 [Candidatus Palauibacterales bacterium]|nr:hypothetical protein [Candidatus Palauibacterales bacterium]MDP2528985.1 hypothetical protein [Candidatus Palauibacterales bacterium]MDP2583803.1 hypothetical protein [Candidatus Palauibacterales bacterium]